MDLPSLHAVLLPNLPSMDPQNALANIMVVRTALSLTKELTLRQMICGNGLVFMEFTGLRHIPHPPTATGLIEQWNGFLKTQFTVPARWQYLLGGSTCKGWPGQCSLGGHVCCKLASGMLLFLPQPGFGNWRLETGVAQLTKTSSDPAAKLCFLSLWPYTPLVLRS